MIHRGHLVEHLTPYDGGTAQALEGLSGRLASSGLPPGVAEESALKLLDRSINLQATMMAYNDVFWIMGLLFVVCLPMLLLLGGRPQQHMSASQPEPAPQRAS
jgi:DHA2 family multidrug resistance protein